MSPRASYRTFIITAALSCGPLAAGAAENQIPATSHQADVLDKAQKSGDVTVMGNQSQASPHQQQVLKQFEAADTNRDGMLSAQEYQAHVVRQQPTDAPE